ncbi:MAG: hypothetical protein IPJ34_14600 [Myxococcales bacterium]|nr:hypothetical protein [Myxococcales bacterium]
MQLSLDLVPRSRSAQSKATAGRGRGGARKGAGRPRLPESESHRARPPVSPQVPQHLTLRMAEHVWNLRAERCFGPIRRAIGAVQREGFRVVHYTVQGNHLHLVVEAQDRAALVFGLRSLTVRIGRALNRVMQRRGRVLDGRPHVRALRTPTEVKNVLRYVLLNRSHHLPDAPWLDECSTAPWFDDWAALEVSRPPSGPPPPERVDRPARTWLLSVGYRRGRRARRR